MLIVLEIIFFYTLNYLKNIKSLFFPTLIRNYCSNYKILKRPCYFFLKWNWITRKMWVILLSSDIRITSWYQCMQCTRIDDALSHRRNLLKNWRGLVHTWNLDDEQGHARDKRAPCREKRSVTVVSRASICRYLFNFSIGKHRHAANTFSAIWLRRLCHVEASQYQHDHLSSSSLLSQTVFTVVQNYSHI